MIDHKRVRLGKAAARRDPRTLRLAQYLASIPLPPVSVDWTPAVKQPWGELLNTQLGCCTISAAGHMIDVWTANAGAEVVVQDADVLAAYECACGYNPADPSTDTGGVELDVLNYWRQTGIGGHKIGAYVAVTPTNNGHVRSAIALFGALYIGLAMPQTAQGQDPWDVADDGSLQGNWSPGSWGGHAVNIVGYDADGLTCITWGAPQKMTWAFFNAYCDEAYAVLSPDFFGAGAVLTPSGFDAAALQSDLAAVTG